MERLGDRYELGDALGQGRSTVYRAVDGRLRRQVAIKRVELLAGQEDAEQVRTRALREAQASARLNNPSVVTVYDVVEESGAIWLVMELVDGPSLAQVVADEGPMRHQRAAGLGLGVLTALEAAHLVGVVHRDVKPANVLVTPGDRAKLTDFGVATIRDESRVTATGLIVGSPSYMSPEQATGGAITPATDLWALGALLYFAVEGEPPFQAGTALATASAVVHGEPRAQQQPGPLSPILARLFIKDPAGRPSAGEVRATLSRVARGQRSRPAPRPTVVPEPSPVAAPAPAGAADATQVHGRSPAPAPAPGPGREREPGRFRRPRLTISLLAGGALVAVAVAVSALTGDDDESAGDRTSPATDSAQPGATSTAVPDLTTVPSTTAGSGEGLPAGWTPFDDPAGAYTIGYPPGWQVEPRADNRIDFVDPLTGSFLRVEWTGTPGPDPAGAWRELEPGFASNNANYEQIGIGPATYRDYDAALWEFRHGAGETLHTGNLGFVTNGRGYALMFRTPEGEWAAGQSVFDQFKQVFQPR
jgi:eukaryotic-like serine/threonine-protein kinase